MASISEMLIQGVQSQTEKSQDLSASAIQDAAALGLKREELEMQKQKLNEQKSQAQLLKYDTLAKSIENGYKLQGTARANYFKNYLPRRAAQLGIDATQLDPSVLDIMTKDENVIRMFTTIRGRAKAGDIKPEQLSAELQKVFTNPEDFARYYGVVLEDFEQGLERNAKIEAQKEAARIAENQIKLRAKLGEEADIRKGRREVQNKIDTKFGEQATKFKSGGMLAAKKNFERIEGAIEKLRGDEELSSRTILGNIPWWSDAAIETFAPETAAVRDDIRGAIQQTLRETLGAQFTEKEGQAIFNRAYNPVLSDEENIRRAELELKFLRQQVEAMDAAVKYYDENDNSLKGFEGPIMSGELVKQEVIKGPSFASGEMVMVGEKEVDRGQLIDAFLKSKNKEGFVKSLMQRTGKTEDEVAEMLKIGGK